MAKDLTIERIFDAPAALVWKAWSDPEMMKKWWGPRMFSAPIVKIDFKVGAKYLLCMSGPMPDGSTVKSWSGGTYKEIVPTSKIVVLDHFADDQGNMVHASQYGLPESFPMESEVTISFKDLGDKTKLTVYYPNLEGIEGMMLKNMTQGWNESVDKLGELVEKR